MVMAKGDTLPDAKGQKVQGKPRCAVSPNMMKLVTLATLLVSDFDIVFTFVTMFAFFQAGGMYMAGIAIIGFFFLLYCAACVYAALESTKFVQRFQDKVKLNEINGITLEDLDDALTGKRIFWRGPVFDAGKRRKGAIDALKALTPDAVDPDEIQIDLLEREIKEAMALGADQLKMPGDNVFGARMVKRANIKLAAAKNVQRGQKGPPISDDVEEEPDFSPLRKQLQEELEKAQQEGDAAKVKMLTFAMLEQLDHFKLDKKLMDANGKVTDTVRALFMLCEAKGMMAAYYRVSRSFARRVVKPSHSIPWYRLMVYGWQPSVNHFDFAGILNASAIYSFSVGLPQLIFSFAFIAMDRSTGREPSPCEVDALIKCGITEDFRRPNVQTFCVIGSAFVCLVSLIISITNIIIDFPAQIFEIVEKEEEALFLQLQAEAATREWEDKLRVEVQEGVKTMLAVSTGFEHNKVPGIEAPHLVLEDVIKLEKQAMRKKIRYLEFFTHKAAEQKEKQEAARRGKREEEEGGGGDERV